MDFSRQPLPLATTGIALAGIAGTLSSLLLANNQIKLCLIVDLAGATLAIVLALCLIPVGVDVYLAALVVHGLIILLLSVIALIRSKGILKSSCFYALVPALSMSVMALIGMQIANTFGLESEWLLVRVAWDAVVFSFVYLFMLRIIFPDAFRDLLNVVPKGVFILRILRLY